MAAASATAWIDHGPASLDDDERCKPRRRRRLVRIATRAQR
jgi:hypothetical protein